MLVFLVRHSTAVDPYAAPSDECRWLTSEGRSRMRRVVEALGSRLTPTRILTSPLVRAVQTAEILALGLDFAGPLQVHMALSAEYGTSAEALAPLQKLGHDESVVLVTHMPKVRVLAGHLAGRDDVPSFRTGSVLCLERSPDGTGALRWMLDPETLALTEGL